VHFAPQAFYLNGTEKTGTATEGDYQQGNWAGGDDLLNNGGDFDVLSVKAITAKIVAKPFFVKIFQAPELDFDKAEDIEALTGIGVKSGLFGVVGEAAHQGITVGLADVADVFDLELYASTPMIWDTNTENAYALGFMTGFDGGAMGVPVAVELRGLGSLSYADAGLGLDEFGLGAKVCVDLLSILNMTDVFYEFKPAILFDMKLPTPDALEPYDALTWQVGADIRLITAKDTYTEPERDLTSDFRLRVMYSDADNLGDLDIKLEANEDDDSGFIPNLEYAFYVLLANMLGDGTRTTALVALAGGTEEVDADLGVDIGAGAGYKVYLDADETLSIEPYASIRYDMNTLSGDISDKDDILKFKIYVEFEMKQTATTTFTLMYNAAQLLDDMTFAYDRYTQTLTAKDMGDITVAAKVSY
jgi:hypothetical protein